MKILYSGYFGDDGYPFDTLADEVKLASYPNDLKEPDSALIIWGGADIDPALYNHEVSRHTWNSPARDYTEWALVQSAIKKGIPIIGVCRGAQMLCAAAGGYLYQHTTHHAGSEHQVTTYQGDTFWTNSIHHQMMGGLDMIDHELLAWATKKHSTIYIVGNKEVEGPEKEPEMVWFPKIKGLAIQWHPEGMQRQSEATKFILNEVEQVHV